MNNKGSVTSEVNGSEGDLAAQLQKRQTCLYEISNLEQDLPIESLLNEVADILPQGSRYPENTVAALEFDGEVYATSDFEDTRNSMSAEAEIREGRPLTVKIVYLGEDESPFLKDEGTFLNTVLNQLELRLDRILSRQEMQEKEQLLEQAFKLARIGSWEFDMQTHELSWSDVTKEVHGFGPDHKPDVESTINLFKEGEHRDTFAKAAYDAIKNEKPFDVELKIISGQGDERWIRARGEPEYNEEGVCTRFYGVSQNVTARRQAEEDLQLRERRFKSLVQDGSDLIAILDSEANYKYVSPTSESILDIPASDFIGTNALEYIHEDDRAKIVDVLENLSESQRINIPPYRFIDSEGNWRWIETTLTDMTKDPAVGGLVANSRDVTKQIQQHQKNLDSIKEKETLLAEIHHRVKNNLAVVSGMMQLQAAEEQDSAIQDRLSDGIVRIKTMANIHEQLYQSSSFSRLEFMENIQSLVSNIMQTFQSETEIAIDYHCDTVELNINQAIPCSLIVNEVVTNIFKHAFPEHEKGNMVISLSEDSEGNFVELSIYDDGIGLPSEATNESGSLGLSLIDVLSQQLEAEYKYKAAEQGTVFSITFDKDEKKGIGNHFM